MKKILFASACVLALTTSAIAQTASSHAVVTRDGVTRYSPGTTVGSAPAANDQAQYGGNPEAGGGPRGSTQSTNNPNASKEIGGGR